MNDYARAPNQSLLTTSSPTFAGLTINGAATFAATVTATGQFLAGNGSAAAPAWSFASDPDTGVYLSGAGSNIMRFAMGGTGCVQFDSNGIFVVSNMSYRWGSGTITSSSDVSLSRLAAASLRLGLAPSATPIAQTFTIGEASRPGTDTNVGGSNGTIRSGLGTGNATGSSLIFQTPAPVGSGSGVQTYETRLTLGAALVVTVPIQTPGATNINANGYFRLAGAGYMYAPSDGVFVFYDEATTSFGRLCFGGTSSAFPALRRTSTQLDCVLADASGYAAFAAAEFQVNGTKVVGSQGAAVADASGGATVDAEARTAINTLLARMRAHGAIAT